MPWTSSERETFAAQMTMLAETLAEPMTPARMAGYVAALEDVPLRCVSLGLQRAMRECTFFPKPVEMRELGEQSKEWRREQERRWDAIKERRQKVLEPPLSDEQIQANIAKLQAVVKGLVAKRRMR